jgi:hypothetical protein
MTTQIIAAGVDVGRDFLDVALAPSGGWFKTANAPAGVAAVVERLKRKGVRRVVLESIGPYGRDWCARLPAPVSKWAWSIRAGSRLCASPKAGAPRPTGWTPVSLRALLFP